jgi:hypothetical protein
VYFFLTKAETCSQRFVLSVYRFYISQRDVIVTETSMGDVILGVTWPKSCVWRDMTVLECVGAYVTNHHSMALCAGLADDSNATKMWTFVCIFISAGLNPILKTPSL